MLGFLTLLKLAGLIESNYVMESKCNFFTAQVKVVRLGHLDPATTCTTFSADDKRVFVFPSKES